MEVTGQKMPSKKYFIAIIIPPPFQSQIEEIKQDLYEKHRLKGALRSPSHITLHRPFEWKDEKENHLIEKLNAFLFHSQFSLEFNNFACFEPRVIYVDLKPSELLEELHTKLTFYCKKELRLFNEAEDLRGFHPHITIAFRDLKKNRFNEVWEQFKARHFTGDFPVSNFSLLRLEKTWQEIHAFQF